MKRQLSDPVDNKPDRGQKFKEIQEKFEKAAEAMRKRLPKITPERQQELNETRAKQTEMRKEPGLAGRQEAALSARAMLRFGVSATFPTAFTDIKKGMVFPVLVKYTNSYTPPNPTYRDIGCYISGGYAQNHIALTLVKATSDYWQDKVEAEFENPMYLSYRNGLNDAASHFMLCNDGTVQYFNKSWKPWTNHIPRWEFAKLPALEVVCSGFDL